MHNLECARPCRELERYVKGYAQRRTDLGTKPIFETAPALLEQTLEFEFGDPLVVRREEREFLGPEIAVLGAHTQTCGYVGLYGHVESFGIFFKPAGLWQLFGVPIRKLVNQAFDAPSVLGVQLRNLWNEMGESPSFVSRVRIIERFLKKRAARVSKEHTIARVANHLFATHGTCSVTDVARQCGLGLRHFERRFCAEVGMTPKRFARVARFETALDAKVACPQRSWLEIAHALHYHDQMHMIHDFQFMAGDSPGRLMEKLGDMRPLALAPEEVVRDFDLPRSA